MNHVSLSLKERSANARLDACLDMNYRAVIDFNPFVSPTSRPKRDMRRARDRPWWAAFFPMNLGQAAIQIRLHLQT